MWTLLTFTRNLILDDATKLVNMDRTELFGRLVRTKYDGAEYTKEQRGQVVGASGKGKGKGWKGESAGRGPGIEAHKHVGYSIRS